MTVPHSQYESNLKSSRSRVASRCVGPLACLHTPCMAIAKAATTELHKALSEPLLTHMAVCAAAVLPRASRGRGAPRQRVYGRHDARRVPTLIGLQRRGVQPQDCAHQLVRRRARLRARRAGRQAVQQSREGLTDTICCSNGQGGPCRRVKASPPAAAQWRNLNFAGQGRRTRPQGKVAGQSRRARLQPGPRAPLAAAGRGHLTSTPVSARCRPSSAWWLSISSGLGTTISALPALSDSNMLPEPAWLMMSDASATCCVRDGAKSKYLRNSQGLLQRQRSGRP